jgi:DNA-binding NarL/FixJ family response regulator
MPDGKVIILVAEGNGEFDVSNILTIAPDGYILNLGSSDVLLKALELLFMDQKIFVIGFPTATPPNKP